MNWEQFFAELVGTFIFLYIILQSGKFGNIQPFVIVFGLLAAILMYGSVSGGHFNPAVSVMKFVQKDPNVATIGALLIYILAQVLGGICALNASKYMNKV